MVVGRELDVFVAEALMGFVKAEKSYYGCTHIGRDGGWYDVPDYSLKPEDTWELIEEFRRRGWTFLYANMRDGRWGHYVTLGVLARSIDSFHTFVTASGDTFSHAVCLSVVEGMKAVAQTTKGTRGRTSAKIRR